MHKSGHNSGLWAPDKKRNTQDPYLGRRGRLYIKKYIYLVNSPFKVFVQLIGVQIPIFNTFYPHTEAIGAKVEYELVCPSRSHSLTDVTVLFAKKIFVVAVLQTLFIYSLSVRLAVFLFVCLIVINFIHLSLQMVQIIRSHG